MARDESTEGWLPVHGGGLSNVCIRKRARLPPDVGGHEYIIYGQRISDQTVILSCVINSDLQYFKVMPTFHHWRAGKQRNGLTFQTAADARAFDKGVIRAYDDLIDGMTKTNNQWNSNKYSVSETSVGEDEVFMTLDLPLEPSESRSSSEGSGSHQSVDKQSIKQQTIKTTISHQHQKQPSIHYISCDKPPTTGTTTTNTDTTTSTNSNIHLNDPTVAPVPGDNYSYVQLTASHDYNYPVVDEPVSTLINAARRDSACSLKKPFNNSPYDQSPPSSDLKSGATIIKPRLRCRYCQEFYSEEHNGKGSCDYAPDCYKRCIEGVSGMLVARCCVYHCFRDAEGDMQHPCACNTESGCTKRWIGLTLLSFLVPCLWCYLPLKLTHRVGVGVGLCGGKHKPQI